MRGRCGRAGVAGRLRPALGRADGRPGEHGIGAVRVGRQGLDASAGDMDDGRAERGSVRHERPDAWARWVPLADRRPGWCWRWRREPCSSSSLWIVSHRPLAAAEARRTWSTLQHDEWRKGAPAGRAHGKAPPGVRKHMAGLGRGPRSPISPEPRADAPRTAAEGARAPGRSPVWCEHSLPQHTTPFSSRPSPSIPPRRRPAPPVSRTVVELVAPWAASTPVSATGDFAFLSLSSPAAPAAPASPSPRT